MKKLTIVCTLLLIAIIQIQCEKNNDSESGDVSIRLEKNHYSINESINIEYQTGIVDSLYLYHCNYQINGIIQRKENREWTNYMTQLCLAIYLSGLMQVPSNKSYVETFAIDEEGEYRAVIYYRLGANASEDNQAISPVFYVE